MNWLDTFYCKIESQVSCYIDLKIIRAVISTTSSIYAKFNIMITYAGIFKNATAVIALGCNMSALTPTINHIITSNPTTRLHHASETQVGNHIQVIINEGYAYVAASTFSCPLSVLLEFTRQLITLHDIATYQMSLQVLIEQEMEMIEKSLQHRLPTSVKPTCKNTSTATTNTNSKPLEWVIIDCDDDDRCDCSYCSDNQCSNIRCYMIVAVGLLAVVCVGLAVGFVMLKSSH
ncbi:Hypothetical protein MVR_LOCUS72 [uncultured virus]|nr:Hypothetical protein MVR_LOCUS72 [uncultured virus]